jgi:hypothetical protein
MLEIQAHLPPQLSISSTNAIISNNSIQYCQVDTPLNVAILFQSYALGKEIYNQTIEFEDYKKLKIDLESKLAGIYQLRIVSEEELISRRIIIR